MNGCVQRKAVRICGHRGGAVTAVTEGDGGHVHVVKGCFIDDSCCRLRAAVRCCRCIFFLRIGSVVASAQDEGAEQTERKDLFFHDSLLDDR